MVGVLTESELVAWGVRLGSGLRPPAIITLTGDLGAGKTTLTQAICLGYGVRDEVTSPTFAIVHVYEARQSPVFHVDLYRLEGPRDLQNIGWDDMIRGDAIVIVEWPERAGSSVPRDAMSLELRLEDGDPTRRQLLQHTPSGAAA
ncbi:MAG TPA: tRNA (adenosine(37)-N6)-threonylcarbamoyltransferase complex ATPase subunit type 1 TsaE [Gemmatimonadaceae bacterium]